MANWSWLLVLLASSLSAQSVRTEDIGVGKFLVAHRKLADPNFAETVVLVVHRDKTGTIGLIVNERTRLTVAKIFEDVKEAAGQSDPMYFGGPVEPRAVMALIRTSSAPAKSEHVFGDIYLVSRKTELDKMIATLPDAKQFRAFMGYSGWGVGQLEAEMKLGSWYVFPGLASTVFDAAPKSVWERLIQLTEQQMALRFHFQAEFK
jgi:putative transcriptional regulator